MFNDCPVPQHLNPKSSLTGFLTFLSLQVCYRGDSSASGMSDKDGHVPLDCSFSEQLEDLRSSSVQDAPSVCLSGIAVLPLCCLDLVLAARQYLHIFEGSIRRATLFRLILRPPISNTYDLGKACLEYCCRTVAAFHSFDSCSGFTLT